MWRFGRSLPFLFVQHNPSGEAAQGTTQGVPSVLTNVCELLPPLPATPPPHTHRSSRDLIYAALLRSMSPEHKFNSAAKLCGEVLAGVADGLLPLSECEEVLRDALCLMACKEIKVGGVALSGLCGGGGPASI